MTPQMILAAVAMALSLLLTVGSILTTSSAIPIPITDLKVAAKKTDLAIFRGDIPIKPIVAELGGQPQANPFTLRPIDSRPISRLPPPPPPPLTLPIPPILPLPEK
jgi:hypothetical protein